MVKSQSSSIETRLFTVDEANGLLPLVRVVVRDIVEMSRSMMDRRELLNELKSGNARTTQDPYSEELADIEDCLKEDADRLRELVAELNGLGVHLRSLPDGEVDFPSVRNGNAVVLCWRFDEPSIGFWRPLGESVTDRRPLDPPPSNRIAAADMTRTLDRE